MQIELLDTFIDLIETRNFNRTAERLGVTQSTVSSRIRALEAQMGKQMFLRGKSGTEVTAAGLRFADYAKAVRLQWVEAKREVQAIGKFDRLIRIGIQHELYGRVLGTWLQWMRVTLPNLAVYVEIDYSNQMILDLTTGNLDVAVLYSPQHLPDIHYEQIAEERFQMVSTCCTSIEKIKLSEYIKANYSMFFNQAHRQLLPDLEHSPISIGHGQAIIHVLRQGGGTAYLTEASANALIGEGKAMRVADAPRISQPIYSAVHVRHSHGHAYLRLLKSLRAAITQERAMEGTATALPDPAQGGG